MPIDFQSSHERNVRYSTLEKVTSAVVAFIVSPIVILELGPERFGIWALINTIIGAYGFLDMGVRAAFEQRLSRAVYTKNQNYVNKVFSTGKNLTTKISIVSIIVSALIYFIFASTNLIPIKIRIEVATCTLVYGLLTASKFAFFPYLAIISALRRFDIRSQVGIVTTTANGVLSVSALKLWPNLGVLSIASSLPIILSFIYTRHLAKSLYPEITSSAPSTKIRHLILGTGVLRLVNAISNHISWQIDSITVAVTCGLAKVAGYSVAASINFQFHIMRCCVLARHCHGIV